MTDSLFTPFRKERCPDWLCPACLNASLAVVPKSIQEAQTALTLRYKNTEGFEVEDYELIFSCMLKCERSDCRESVSVSGKGLLIQDFIYGEYGIEDVNYVSEYRAKTFFPPLPLFVPPAGCPEYILDQLKEISALLTGHPAAAANAIRSLLEVLLDDLKVPRMVPQKNPQKQRALKLHERIENYGPLLGPHKPALMALKLLGNAGSHGGTPIQIQHLDDACAVLEQMVMQLYQSCPDLSDRVSRLNNAFSTKPEP